MNKTSLSLFAAVTALLGASCVHAQDAAPRMYAEFGYTQFQAKGNDGVNSVKFSPAAVTGMLGYQFTPNLAMEGLIGLGAGEGKVKLNGVQTGVMGAMNKTVGLFFKPSVAVSDRIDLFARVGWVHAELELSAAGVSRTSSGSGGAYGVGANFNVSKTSYIQASWMNYYKKDGIKIDGFNVAYGFRF